MISRLARWLLVLPGEGRVVAYVVLLNFLVGIGMTVGNTSSDALFFKRFGVEYMPHMLVISSLLLVVFGTVYASMADKVRTSSLSVRMLGALAVCLALLWVFVRMGGGKGAILGYYLCYAIVSELLLAHMSHYYLSFFDATQSRRLFPLISAGQRLGAVIGGLVVSAALNFLVTEDMMLIWVLTLIAAVLMVVYYHRHDSGRSMAACGTAGRGRGMFTSVREGLEYARTSRLLQLTGAGVFVLILIYSTQDYLVSTIFTRQFNDERSLAAFLGWFYAAVNAAALLFQTLLTSRMLRRFGMKVVNMVFPVSCLVSFGLLALSPTLIPAMIGRLNYAGLMRAFRHPTFELYFHGFPAYMQGRARAAIVSFVLPAAFAVAGGMMMMVPDKHVTIWLGWAGVGLSLIYMLIKWKKNQAYGESLGRLIKQQVFSPADGAMQGVGSLDPEIVDSIVVSLRETEDEGLAAAYVEILAQGAPGKVGRILLEIAPRFSDSFQDKVLKKIARLRPEGWQEYARNCLLRGDSHLCSTALVVLLQEPDSPEWTLVEKWMKGEAAPRQRGAVVQVILSGSNPSLKTEAGATLENMLCSTNPADLIAGLAAVRDLGEHQWLGAVRGLLGHEAARVRAAAVLTLGSLFGEACEDAEFLRPAFDDRSSRVRVAAVMAVSGISDLFLQVEFLALVVHDPDFEVRRAVETFAEKFEMLGKGRFIEILESYFDNFEIQRLILRMAAKGGVDDRRTILRVALERNLDMVVEKKRLMLELDSVAKRENRAGSLPARFIAEVLEEEIQRHLELGLLALELLDEGQAVSTIRAAWASRSRHLRSLALESLRHGENDETVQRMLLLLEAQLSQNWQEIIALDLQQSWDVTLEKCRRIGSNWLKQCVCELVPG